jgi:lipid-binding SYLF domain-containing protein
MIGHAPEFGGHDAETVGHAPPKYAVGVGPSVVLIDEGMAKTLTTTTAKDDIYAFIFGQKGLMAGLGIQGNKITRLKD